MALCASFAFAQAPAGDKVVATINGKPVKAKELEEFAKGLPPQFQQFYQQDKEGFIKQVAVLEKFSMLAVAAKVDQQTPYKQRLEFNRQRRRAACNAAPYR